MYYPAIIEIVYRRLNSPRNAEKNNNRLHLDQVFRLTRNNYEINNFF